MIGLVRSDLLIMLAREFGSSVHCLDLVREDQVKSCGTCLGSVGLTLTKSASGGFIPTVDTLDFCPNSLSSTE